MIYPTLEESKALITKSGDMREAHSALQKAAPENYAYLIGYISGIYNIN